MTIEHEPVTRPLELEEVTMTLNAYHQKQDLAVAEGRRLERQHIIKLLDQLAAQAPMRGDIALSDLRRLIEKDTK